MAAAHIQRRIREQYGERETVTRATRRVIRSYLDWGVLQPKAIKGIYRANPSIAIDSLQLISWLIEASLHARTSGSAPLKGLINSPSLFPFRLKLTRVESLLGTTNNLNFLRHSLDEDLVMLQKTGL